MTNNPVFDFTSLLPILPEIVMAIGAMVLLVFGVFRGDSSARVINLAAIAALLSALGLVIGLSPYTLTTLNNAVITDPFSQFGKSVIAVGLMAALLLAHRSLRQGVLARFEFPILVLLSGIGMMLMVSANNFLSLYVALELQSLPLYVLAALRRDNAQSAEAGVKYFVLGALSSGFLLFGISLLYGFAGTLDFGLLAGTLMQNGAVPGAVIGMVFVLTGIAFKMSSVPFHMWTPDVYQGAPTTVTALFAIVPKVAAVFLLLRLLNGPFAPLTPDWTQVIVFLSVASMVWGALAGLVQQNIKRLLAYSSIGNMGYALLGVLAASPEGAASVLLYMMIYMIMTAGTFALILSIRRGGEGISMLTDVAGLSKSSPVKAYALAALMFSMSGIPPLAGFFGKVFVFQAAMQAGFFAVAVMGVITSVVAAYYYLKIIKIMFFDDMVHDVDHHDASASRHFVACVSLGFVMLFIIMPNNFTALAQTAAQSLFG
jgi:NADH-quinone oxidoreductase subunit N